TGTTHDVVIDNASMIDIYSSHSKYWNGDGFATEAGVYDVLIENTYAADNTDAGYDIKSASTTLLNAVSEENKRNFRLWNTDTILQNAVSIDPHYQGGKGGPADVWLAPGASATLIGCSIADSVSPVACDLSEI